MEQSSLKTRRDFLRRSMDSVSAVALAAYLRGSSLAGAATRSKLLVGINYPWAAYGHDCGTNAWGHDGFTTGGWTAQTWADSQGFTDARYCRGTARTGGGSLCITADLVGLDPHKSRGEVLLDLRTHPPGGVTVPIDLQGRSLRCWLYLPQGSAGQWPSAPNGVQLLCKSEGWGSWYGRWQNIQPQWEQNWVEVVVSLSDPPGYRDPQFDPTKVIAVGLKVAINDASAATLSGMIYVDDYVVGSNPSITFDFEQLEVERDFIALRQALERCSDPVVRVFIFADGRASPDFTPSGEVAGFDKYFVQDFDTLLTVAQQHKLLLVPVLLDFSWCDAAKLENGVQLGGHADIIRDATKRQTFLDRALRPLIERYRGMPQILAWDLINEPEWAMQGKGGSGDVLVGDPVTIQEMQEFVRLCAETIHTYSAHKVTVGSARLPWLLDYWQGLGLDLYQFHWYDHLGDPFPWPPYADLRLDKPCIIGEVPTIATQYSTAQYVKVACEQGYHGVLLWSYRAADAFSCFSCAKPGLKRWCQTKRC